MGEYGLIIIGEDVIMIYNATAILVFASLIIYLSVGFRGLARIVLTVALMLVLLLHYVALAMISRFVYISFLPLMIIESTREGSVIYPDLGQIIALTLLVAWRKQITRLIRGLIGGKHGGVEETGNVDQAREIA